jgi:YD repeat-containing protein
LTGAHFTDPTDDIIYTYDKGTNGIGRLTSMTDPSGNTSFGYDPRGRLVEKTSIIKGLSYSFGRIYSPGGRVATVTYPSGRTLEYARNGMGKMQGLSTTYNANTVSLVNNITYNPFGGPRGLRTGAGGEVNNQSGECQIPGNRWSAFIPMTTTVILLQ